MTKSLELNQSLGDSDSTVDFAGLPNLGPRSVEMLRSAGILSVAELRQLGAVAAFARVRRSGAKASLNLLWALEGALSGLSWRTVAAESRLRLLLELERHTTAGD